MASFSMESFVAEPVAEPVAEFGPDFTATPHDTAAPAPEPQQTTRVKNKAAGEQKAGIFSNLGKNSPARSSVRKLTEDDALKLADRYDWLAGTVKYFHPRLGKAIEANAEKCVISWMNLAEHNVKVRAKLLAFIEGGEIMGVVMAHVPILIAALPEKYVAMFMQGVMSAFGQFVQSPDDDSADVPSPEFDPAMQQPPFQRAG